MISMHIMHTMHLSSVDLNQLVVLDALLRERSVTRAARRVGLSQSATSHALARLRALLEDPLLVRSPSGLVPTERALALMQPLAQSLAGLQRALSLQQTFDPMRSARVFRLATSDYAQFVLFPRLVSELETQAPNVAIGAIDAGATPSAEWLEREDIDFLAVPEMVAKKLKGMHRAVLFDERFVCMVRRDHPRVRTRLTLKVYTELHHALIAPRGEKGGFVDDALAARGLERHVSLMVPHFLVAPHVVAHSDLIITLAERVARSVAAYLPLRILPLPLSVPGFSMSLVWHPRHHNDPGHRWMRAMIQGLKT